MEDTLSNQVLVLNRLWQAVNIVGLKRAFGLLFQEHAKVIHSDDGNFLIYNGEEWVDYSLNNPSKKESDSLKTINYKIRIPKVILLNQFDRLPMKEMKFTRQSLYERDSSTCQYCGKIGQLKDLNLDHIIPRERGGRTTWENVVTSCIKCNSRKANKLPHEAGMRLKRKPNKPKWRPFVSYKLNGNIDTAWSQFLQVSKY